MTPEPTRDQIRAGIEAQICPWCGAGPFKILAGHTTRLHGVDRRQLRDLAGMFFKDPACAPEVTEAFRERAKQSARVPTPSKGYRKNLSEAAAEANRRKLDAVRSPEQRAAATAASHTPEAKSKRSATLRQRAAERWGEMKHGTERCYHAGCRCGDCKAAHAQHFRERRAEAHCRACGHARESHNGSSHIGACGTQSCSCRRYRSQGGQR